MLGDDVSADIPSLDARTLAVSNKLERPAQRWISLVPHVTEKRLVVRRDHHLRGALHESTEFPAEAFVVMYRDDPS